MLYHVRISTKSNPYHDETRIDLIEEQLNSWIVEPYEAGEPFIVNGKTIRIDDIERIRISRSEGSATNEFGRLEAEDASSGVVFIGGASNEWRAADRLPDVTDDWIRGVPGYKKKQESSLPAKATSQSKENVFVVHGHDAALKDEICMFLVDVGLQPIVLHREPNDGLTVIEKFERYAGQARYALVLVTPDDIATSREDLAKSEDNSLIEFRARQNVMFEWGYFVGALGRHAVCCIFRGGVTLPSDLVGLLYKEVTESVSGIGYELIQELQSAGLSPQIQPRNSTKDGEA